MIVDESLLEVFEGFRHAREFEHVIVVSQKRPVPDGMIDYESLIESHEPMQWPALEERRAAAMCYTSGTTGRPKGVVYSHRSLVLHSLMAALPDSNGASAHDTILPVVPMFHANAWGLPYTGTFVGAALVLPGPKLDAESVLDLLADERVTLTAGVPTVWMAVLQALDAEPDRWDLSALQRLLVGGSAVPSSLLEGFDRHGLTIIQAWGMTETSPLGQRVPAHARPRRCTVGASSTTSDPAGGADPVRRRPGPRRRRRADRLGRPGDGRAGGPRPLGRGRLPPWHGRREVHRGRLVPVPATSSRSTPTAASASATGPRTWSSPAASGSPRSTSRTC